MISETALLWALVSVSLFNTILLLWLGLTLWLNADRRSPGVVVTSIGFLLGSAFFTSHAALLLSPTLRLTRSTTLWLAAGMTPVVLLPYVWYVVLLWYNGYWTPPAGDLRRRQWPWLWMATAVLVAGLVCLLLLGAPFVPVVRELTPWLWPARQLIKTPILGVPLVAIGFPLYVLLCVLLSLDATRRPGHSGRILGEAARERARPWLIVATLLLLLVGFLVAAVVLWTITHTRVGGFYILTPNRMDVIGRFDLAISALLAGVTVLLGQAMTAYELFTGKALPRRGLARQWQRAVVLAVSYGLLMGGALVWGLDQVYAILLTAVLMTGFFALLSWSSYLEWDQAMRQLRPFVASQRWYDALVTRQPVPLPAPDPFRALCENVLNATVAYLVPMGSTAALVAPLAFPASPEPFVPSLTFLSASVTEGNPLVLAIEPKLYAGAVWAVPLWRERGLVGALLLGPRADGSLYTQEEVEIARSTGERLLDTAASLAMSQRLMQLQRERMAATQVLDQRTRRVLHDEVLPSIHAAMLSLASGGDPSLPQALPQGKGRSTATGQAAETAVRQLSEVHAQLADLLHELPPSITPEIARLGLFGALRRAVEIEFGQAFASVEWSCQEGVEKRAGALSPVVAETVYFAARELVRNAARHARPAQGPEDLRLKITARVDGESLSLVVEDNGADPVGSPPGANGWTAKTAGTEHGLALHGTMMAIVGGSLALEKCPDQKTRAQLTIPVEAGRRL